MTNRVSTKPTVEAAGAAPNWVREWDEAAAVDRADAAGTRISATHAFYLVAAAVLAGLLPAILPLSPGYAERNSAAQVVAAAIAAIVGVGVVPLAAVLARRVSRSDGIRFGAALLSAGAAAIHFAVAKDHFDQYFLFGLFFVLSGVAQLAWAVLILFVPSRLFLVLGAVGNTLIAVLWGVDRIWGIPIGPEPWTPESVGFADVTASAFEVALVLACLALLARGASGNRRGLAVALTIAVMVLTAMGLLSAVGIGSPLITPSA